MGRKLDPKSKVTNGDRRYTAPALEKGLEIIELLARIPGGLGLTAISEQLGRTKTEIFRMVAVLHDAEYIEYFESERIYRLSLKLFRISHRFAPVHQLTTIAVPIMQEWCNATSQSCHLVAYSMGGGLILAHQDADNNANRLTLPVGGKGPLLDNCAGHVLLAFAPYDTRKRMLKAYEDGTKVTVNQEKLRKILERVKHQGYESMESPVLKGVHDIGWPIMDRYGNAVAVLMMSMLLYKNSDMNSDLATLVASLRSAAEKISEQTGFGVEPDPK